MAKDEKVEWRRMRRLNGEGSINLIIYTIRFGLIRFISSVLAFSNRLSYSITRVTKVGRR